MGKDYERGDWVDGDDATPEDERTYLSAERIKAAGSGYMPHNYAATSLPGFAKPSHIRILNNEDGDAEYWKTTDGSNWTKIATGTDFFADAGANVYIKALMAAPTGSEAVKIRYWEAP